MNFKSNSWEYRYIDNPKCIICGEVKHRKLGQRGNREYMGANYLVTPHIFTTVVKCVNCGFIFCNPAIQGIENLEREHYNNPDIYGAYLKENIYSVYKFGQKIIEKIKPKGKLLDIGAGKGDFISLSKRNGYDAKGIEPSLRFCEYARDKHDVNIVQGYLGDGDFFKGEQFDIITLFHVLEHVNYPQKLLNTILKYLKEDGIVYIEVPNADSMLLKIVDCFFRINGKNWSSRLSPLHAPFHTLGYSPSSLKYLLENNGFDLLYYTTFSGKVRGYDFKLNLSTFFLLVRNFIMSSINILPNRELIAIIAKKKTKN